jgi:hypothetical protein
MIISATPTIISANAQVTRRRRVQLTDPALPSLTAG